MIAKQQDLSEYQLASKIKELGWRQGSIFIPSQVDEFNFSFDIDDEVCVIITHSCTVVSPNFDRDPNVEVLAAKKLQEFDPKGFEARGKNQRIFHIGISRELMGCEALALDINRRHFFDRKRLPDFPLIGSIGNKSKDLAGWLARSYTRVALPDDLVESLKDNLYPILNKILRKKFEEQPLHAYIDITFLRWERGQTTSNLFILDFCFMCISKDSADFLDELLIDQLEPSKNRMENICINSIRCGTKGDLFYADTDGYDRFSEWDHLTCLGEVAGLIDKKMT